MKVTILKGPTTKKVSRRKIWPDLWNFRVSSATKSVFCLPRWCWTWACALFCAVSTSQSLFLHICWTMVLAYKISSHLAIFIIIGRNICLQGCMNWGHLGHMPPWFLKQTKKYPPCCRRCLACFQNWFWKNLVILCVIYFFYYDLHYCRSF